MFYFILNKIRFYLLSGLTLLTLESKGMEEIPADVLNYMFNKFFKIQDLGRLNRTCKQFHDILHRPQNRPIQDAFEYERKLNLIYPKNPEKRQKILDRIIELAQDKFQLDHNIFKIYNELLEKNVRDFFNQEDIKNKIRNLNLYQFFLILEGINLSYNKSASRATISAILPASKSTTNTISEGLIYTLRCNNTWRAPRYLSRTHSDYSLEYSQFDTTYKFHHTHLDTEEDAQSAAINNIISQYKLESFKEKNIPLGVIYFRLAEYTVHEVFLSNSRGILKAIFDAAYSNVTTDVEFTTSSEKVFKTREDVEKHIQISYNFNSDDHSIKDFLKQSANIFLNQFELLYELKGI